MGDLVIAALAVADGEPGALYQLRRAALLAAADLVYATGERGSLIAMLLLEQIALEPADELTAGP